MKSLTEIKRHKFRYQHIYYLVLLSFTQQTSCNYSAYSYKTNLPFNYNAQKNLKNVPVASYYHHHPQRQPQLQSQASQHKQQEQHSYLSLPFFNSYASNLHKKPTTTSTFIFNQNTKHRQQHASTSHGYGNYNHNHNNNNMHIYSKRYKRYPPFATMPEIPIKKTLSRYLPYAQMYPMGIIAPSILIPVYVAPAKATTRFLMKPKSTAWPLQTDLNKTLLLNYLRLTNDKKNQLKSLTTTTTTTTTTTNKPAKPATTTSTLLTTIGNYLVDSHIKFYDTPFSASNLQQQQKQYYQQHYNHNNFATHFLLPMMATTTTTTTSTTAPPLLHSTEKNFERMPSSIYGRGQIVDDKGDYEFLPTWYSTYAKPQAKKYSSFFTIEDAITPYKPIQPLTIGYQPQSFYYENTQTENYAQIKPTMQTSMEFSPLRGTEEYVVNKTTTTTKTNAAFPSSSSTSSTTMASFLEELSREASKWKIFREEEAAETTTTIKQALNTMGTLKIEEINLTTSAPIAKASTRNMSKLERALKMAENVEPHRIRASTAPLTTTTTTSVDRKSTKKMLRNKSFFEDWFADEKLDESTEATKNLEKALTTTPTSAVDNKLHKLKWPTQRRHQNITRTTTTTTTTLQTPLVTTVGGSRSVLKKPRKKYGNAKAHKIIRNFTSKPSDMKLNGTTTKLVKRIKKVVRVRPTLFSILKLQNKNIEEQIDRPLQGIDVTPNSLEDNESITLAPQITTTILQPSVSTTTTTTTTSTTTSSTSSTSQTNIDNTERTRFGGTQRKRGRLGYRNSNRNERSSTTEPYVQKERVETNKKSRQAQSRQKSTSTTATTTIALKNHRHNVDQQTIKKPNELYVTSSSTTMESAIMKISRNKRINNILENLLITPSTSVKPSVNEGLTELPQLPIELYFQKIKTGGF